MSEKADSAAWLISWWLERGKIFLPARRCGRLIICRMMSHKELAAYISGHALAPVSYH
jgi:hypothetical protein